MQNFSLTLSFQLPDDATPTTGDLFDLLETALQSASENPACLMAQITSEKTANRPWVMRSIEKERVIFLDGKEVSLGAEGVPPDAFFEGERARHLPAEDGAFWCHKDFLAGTPVLAHIYSDDHVVSRKVDIRPYLRGAGYAEIAALNAAGWSFSDESDHVAYLLEGFGDPSASQVFFYLGLNPESLTGDPVGFSVEIDGDDAIAWLKENRADMPPLEDYFD